MININQSLEKIIFEDLGAIYDPNAIRVKSNKLNDKEDNLIYLGTYFPRSFVEAYEIYNNLFKDKDVYQYYNSLENIYILDIGSGTGGSIFGLLNAFVKYFNRKNIIIYSCDANKDALDFQEQIYNRLSDFLAINHNTFNLRRYHFTFKDKQDLIKQFNNFTEIKEKINIMQTFKFVNEFYREDYSKNQGMFRSLIKLSTQLLDRNGILCLLDITDKVESNYNSIIMNQECVSYFNFYNDINYVLPKSCSIYHKNCKETDCFSKEIFYINHRNKSNDVSKVNHKIFIKDDLGSLINNSYSIFNCYVVDDENRNCCTYNQNTRNLNRVRNNLCGHLNFHPHCNTKQNFYL